LGYKKALIRLFDRPGGRFVLGKVATVVGRRISRTNITVEYVDGRWIRRIESCLIPGSPQFDYSYQSFCPWEQKKEYASETWDYWLRFYRPSEGDTIIDVGAGHGEDTLTFSRVVGASGRVIAIEAHPLCFDGLKNFCRRNRLSNVQPVCLALMDKPGEVRLAESESWAENHVAFDEDSSGITVPSGTLDDLCAQQGITDIAFLKMNIEGAERRALLGAKLTMPRIRQICVACHDFRSNQGHGEYFRTRIFVERFLSESGFVLCSRPDDPRDYVRDHVFGFRKN
jgi:FkbM family methyltransferase